MYLIRNVSPALATSYAYVNPVVAVLLGTGLGGETLSKIEWLALGVIVFAVVLVTFGKISLPGKPRSCASYSGRIKRVNESPACRSARWHLRRRSTLPDAR
ncbi:putative DMT superfamily transporter inner membrane protein [Escherichia coli]|uniref:Putative DMT superfamily transporter inner membrane protein n=1 Tax=Escherichia coli TaxID=562 RepID=A0A377B9N0_ECOLX|nr:putative DMT superfamily transporter inner membrane protein [Escherichia coli]